MNKPTKNQKILLCKLMKTLKQCVECWENVPRTNLHNRLNGLLFSILCEIDGVGEMGCLELTDIESGETINYCGELHSILNRFDWEKEYEKATKEHND